jgi:hypothetical protein
MSTKMFTGEVQCNVSDEMIAHVRGIPLPDGRQVSCF